MQLSDIPAFIPAAGFGTRLLPATLAIPKPLLPLGTTPIIIDILWELYNAGVRKAFIITHWRENVFKALFQDPQELKEWLEEQGKHEYVKKIERILPKIDIEFIRQDPLNGLGGAIQLAESHVDDYFLVVLSDNVLFEEPKGSLLQLLYKVFSKYNASTAFAVASVPKHLVSKFGVIAINKEELIGDNKVFLISNIIEKPAVNEAPSNFVIVGRYIFDSSIFDYLREIKPIRGEIDETEAFRRQIQDKKRVVGLDIGPNRSWFDIGTVEGYLKAFIRYTIMMEGWEVVSVWLREILQ